MKHGFCSQVLTNRLRTAAPMGPVKLGHELGLGLQRVKILGKPQGENRKGCSCKDELQLDTNCLPTWILCIRAHKTQQWKNGLREVQGINKGHNTGSMVLGLEEIMSVTINGRNIFGRQRKDEQWD